MGGKVEWPDWPVIWETVARGGSEWEAVIHHFGYDTDDDLTGRIELVLRIPEGQWIRQKPHAYSDQQLETLLRALASSRPPKELRRTADQFAAFVGTQALLTPQLTPSERANEPWEGIITPAGLLEQTLQKKKEVLKDLLGAKALEGFDPASFSAVLRQLRQRALDHVRAVEGQKRSGKRWDQELCKLHVYMAALFSEYINPDFDPSRGQRFETVVYTLAEPIFDT